MKITEVNLAQNQKVELYSALAREVLSEFSELERMYDEMAIAIAYKKCYYESSVDEAVREFFGVSAKTRIHGRRRDIRPAHSISSGRRGG